MAEFGSSEAGKKGGKARAENLSKEQRSEIARQAADARWEKEGKSPLPLATHGSDDHPLLIGDIEIPCYVLDNGTRVISQRGLQTSLGMNESGGAQRIGKLLGKFDDKGLDCKGLAVRMGNPIVFRMPHGGKAHGYEATILADFCELILDARTKKLLAPTQLHYAKQCEILVRGFARVGIIALVDEATGYERDKVRDDLARILEAFVAKEIQGYLKTFDLEFYELMCDLRGEPLERVKNRPPYFGKLTDNLIYQRLAPGVREKLRELNPVQDNGRRKRKLFQHLTPDLGHPKLKEHLAGVTTAMKMAKFQGWNWSQFLKMLDKTHPKQRELPLFDHMEDE